MFHWLDSTIYNCTQYYGNATLHFKVFLQNQHCNIRVSWEQWSSAILVIVIDYLLLKYHSVTIKVHIKWLGVIVPSSVIQLFSLRN